MTRRDRLARAVGALAAPFIVTAGLSGPGCSSTKTGGTIETPRKTHTIGRRADGSCWRSENITCPPDATCNPPPPEPVDCPDPSALDWDNVEPTK